ncbi:helix-turn-helix domain-containing protein [Pararhodobacter sp. CCB-MM2]|uniref:helix-turn-helix domain-containing protein n=1 Tax=Pararhodobacter sp. CCB-MM2 TaxID=1786003 RepID=UPI001314EFF4
MTARATFEGAEPARPFTPEELAIRWQCSAETVRAMVRDGRLPAFRAGRMMRIPVQTVEDFECGTIASGASTGAGSSCGMKTESADAFVFRLTRGKKPSEKRATKS